MELKLVRSTGRYDESSCSNRTFMELKYNKLALIIYNLQMF